jgi:hypothetical protein
MDHPLQRLLSELRKPLPGWLGGQGGQPATAPETAWPLADALLCNRGLGGDFAPEALPAGDARFVGRTGELETLGGIVERWRSGHAIMAAVTGPQGCGITSLLNQVPGLLAADTVYHSERLGERLRDSSAVLALVTQLFDLQTAPDSSAALIDQLNAAVPRVVILDNAHFLAFRVMGARDAARRLGAVMVATQPRHLWIMGCRRQAWLRMAYLHQVERFFTHVLELDYFSAEQLGELIAARQSAPAADAPPPDLPRLHQLCRGKPDLGFLYLHCGTSTEAGSYRPLDVSILKRLEMDELFTLAELAVHGSLHSGEHSQIFRLSPQNSQLQLNQLCNQGLVERLGPDGASPEARYRITPILSALVSDHLYKSNYLY